jgi:hypothetical protein
MATYQQTTRHNLIVSNIAPFSGDVQWPHRQEDERSDLLRSDLLPTFEAHGGRQDPQQS